MGLLTTKPDISWAGRLELDSEEREECRETENEIPCTPSTIREGGEKAGGKLGTLFREHGMPVLTLMGTEKPLEVSSST